MTDHMIQLDEVWTFCTARLHDDETAALSAKGNTHGRWEDNSAPADRIVLYSKDGKLTVGQARHIARHDPARVLADVAFKRNLLAEHEPTLQATVKGDEATPVLVCRVDGDNCSFAQALASLYDDHPDYKASWRP